MSGNEERIKKNIEINHQAIKASRINKNGLTDKKVKLSSKNFDRLMMERGIPEETRTALKKSNDQKVKLEIRHAKAGEKFITTHGKERSSGIFVSERSLGKTTAERIDKGALPMSNSAEYETIVELTKNQNLIYGRIAPQSKFAKMDGQQRPRSGGGEQVITDGGYHSGAVRNKDAKYPVPIKILIQQGAEEYKLKHGLKNNHVQNQANDSCSRQKSCGQKR